MDIKTLNRELQLAVPGLKPGYLAVKRIGKGGVGEGVYRCRNPRIVLKVQSSLLQFKALYDSGVLNSDLFPRVYKLVTDHPRYKAGFKYHLLWRESCQLPPLKERKIGYARGYRYDDFLTADDQLANEARRLLSSSTDVQHDNQPPGTYKLPQPWRLTPPAELVRMNAAIQKLQMTPSQWQTFTSGYLDIHLQNFGFVYRGRGAKRTRHVVIFDPVVY